MDWDTLHKEVWLPCRDLYEEMSTAEHKRRNLIRRPAEPEDAYARRVQSAYLDNHFAPALRRYAALLGRFDFTSKTNAPPATITDADRATPEGRIASDIDLCGNDFRSFLSQLNQMTLCFGAAVCVIDTIEIGGQKRPYLRLWNLDEIYCRVRDTFSRGLETIVEGGKVYLSAFAGRYSILEEEEGVRTENTYFIEYQHRPARTQLWKQSKDGIEKVGGENRLISASGKPIEELPVVWHDFSGNPIGDPPLPILFSLARLNITHFNSLSEFQTILTVVNGPTPVRTWSPNAPVPEERQDLFLGINSVLDMPGGSNVHFLEPSGNALSISWEVINGQVLLMERLGQQMLGSIEHARTATEATLLSAQSQTLVTDIANRVENTAEEIFKWWKTFEDPTYTYPDYAGGMRVQTETLLTKMTPTEINAVRESMISGLYDEATALRILLRGRALLEEDLSDELKALLHITPH